MTEIKHEMDNEVLNKGLYQNNPGEGQKRQLKCSDWPSSKLEKFSSRLTHNNISLGVRLEPRVFQRPSRFRNSPEGNGMNTGGMVINWPDLSAPVDSDY